MVKCDASKTSMMRYGVVCVVEVTRYDSMYSGGEAGTIDAEKLSDVHSSMGHGHTT